ncbi:porin family protein [Plesiomonas shigelloides]|uniref:porin family protein n=1 Tax=Plesiomonas shigelloides TaxID=703 RepID=UPI001CE39CE6|nr:porin family protein [Plesiomonas shigelloides]
MGEARSAVVDNKKNITLSAQELSKYPKILSRALIQSVMKSDYSSIRDLLPIYSERKDSDAILIAWSKAIIASENRKYSEAIGYYRTVIAAYPKMDVARMQLAIALFKNKDNTSALQQFNQLRAKSENVHINKVIDAYIEAINSRDSYSFSVGVNYLNESNINNAPSANARVGAWKPQKKQSGHGFSYYLSSEKTWSLPYGFFSEARLSADGKYYTNNHKYDQATGRVSAGAGYRNVDFSIVVLPFFEQEFESDDISSSLSVSGRTPGLRIETDYRLSPQWKLSVNGERSKIHDDKYSKWSSNNLLLSEYLFYIPKPTSYYFFGNTYSQELAEVKSHSFEKMKWTVGWGNEWNYGISTIMRYGIANKNYKGADFFGIKRRGEEHDIQLTFWHRDIYFAGVTPKVNVSYFKNNSNHPFYNYDKTTVFLTFSKLF